MFWLCVYIAILFVVVFHYPEYRALKRTGFITERNFLIWLYNKYFR